MIKAKSEIFVGFDYRNTAFRAATTLKGLCEIIDVPYQSTARKMKKDGSKWIMVGDWWIDTVELVKSETRGGVSNFRKNLTTGGELDREDYGD